MNAGPVLPDLSVIIVSWNTAPLLRACLDSIRQHSTGVSTQIIVVDNASDDGSAEMVAGRYPGAVLISNASNLGYARANNQGISRASGRYVLLLNSDTEVRAGALAAMVAYMDGHPQVGAAGPRLIGPDGTIQRSYDLFPLRPWQMAWQKGLDVIWPGNALTRRGRIGRWDPTRPLAVDWLVGAALLVRGDVIALVGGLDERFWMYGEDLDWCYRIRRTGWQVHYLPQAAVYHRHGGSSERSPGLARQLARRREESLVLFYRKHYGALAALGLRPILAIKRRRAA
ncbi:MAG: glycosyltransferase family 2 protein [Anaerolineae bacterium]|nr:glycosyltransferase family 2 protein [Anaerolineae bacterium]